MGPGSEITADYVLHYLSGAERGVLLACLGGHVAGLLSYSLRADLYHAGISVLIEELVVEAESRGQGIGGALMDQLLLRAEGLGCKELCLAVMPENEGAIRFYKRHGLLEEALFLERHFNL
jgi:ribosomal protein S18 acetylase RimI-like enzyme